MKYQYTFQTPNMPQPSTAIIEASSEPQPSELQEVVAKMWGRRGVLIEDADITRINISGVHEVCDE